MQKQGEAERAGQLKRLAAQILTQLPETKEEALMVLAIAQELVEWEAVVGSPLAPVLRIVG